MPTVGPSSQLARFAAALELEQLPAAVIARTEELFLDWIAAALAAKGQHPIPEFEAFAHAMGPRAGRAEILVSRGRSSPYFAAWINAAASHTVEQDDLHGSSVLHPATVVFPAALATAQELGLGGAALITGVVAGYEVGVRVGEFLGRSHYRIFHTTATAGTLAAAAAVGRLLELTPVQMLDAFGSAGTQAAGLWEFLRDAADSKQLHTAHASASGLAAAHLARAGVKGAREILEGSRGMGAGLSSDAAPGKLTAQLGERWALTETSFKLHASCRHTHPAADALAALMRREGLHDADITKVVAHVHSAALDVLGAVGVPTSVHQAKFSMGTVLGLIAVYGRAGLEEFRDYALSEPRVAAFRERVHMLLDPRIDQAYPEQWLGRVEVTTRDGRVLESAIEAPKGDPGDPLTRAELEDKLRRLVRFSDAASPTEAEALIARAWSLRDAAAVTALLPD